MMTILTPKERERQILLCTTLGPIFPLFGIIESSSGALACECGKPDCVNAGKHPRRKGYRKTATTDPARIRRWFRRYPHGNFGILTGPLTIALDADVRPDRNGLRTLEQLEVDEGKRIPDTVQVLSGRGAGKHFFFNPPADARIRTGVQVLPGVDVRAKGGYTCAAGSRHICGGFYHFAEQYSPDEQAVADLPDFLFEALAASPSAAAVRHQSMPVDGSLWGTNAVGARAEASEPDNVVLGVMLHDPVARFYWEGGRKKHQTRSGDDYALACKLAFYCSHNLDQMYRLFMRSGLRRPKFLEPRSAGNYALWTLKRAIEDTSQTWKRAKRKRPSAATGAKKGRKLSVTTIAILNIYQSEPELTAAAIADRLDLSHKQVQNALYYHRTENAVTLIHTTTTA